MLFITMSWTVTTTMLMIPWSVSAQAILFCTRLHVQLPLWFIMSILTLPDGQIYTPAYVSLRTEWLTMVLNPKFHYYPRLLLLWLSVWCMYTHTQAHFLNISWISLLLSIITTINQLFFLSYSSIISHLLTSKMTPLLSSKLTPCCSYYTLLVNIHTVVFCVSTRASFRLSADGFHRRCVYT